MKTKKKVRSQPIVDANDVAKLLLALIFVLDGLGQPELEAHNRQQARPRDRVRDPFRPIIGAINAYLHAYHMYRAEALRMPEIERLNTVSRNALETLQRVFPYGVRSKNGTFRSWFCTEKPHSMTHWADNYAAVGRTRIWHLHLPDGGPDEDGRQDQGEEDQQPSIVRRQHPQGQHGGGGGDPAGARPGRDRYALRVHRCWIARCFARFA
jgi:hypothetical protein